MISVLKYEKEFQEKILAYIHGHPESMFFHSGSYLTFLEQLLKAEPAHIIALNNNEVVGVIPILKKSGPWGTLYNSLPYYGSNGSVLADSEEIALQLIAEYNNLITSEGVVGSVWVENLLGTTDYSEKVTHNIKDYRIGQFTRIAFMSNHSESIMNLIHYKTRNMVRKGQKSGFTVKINNSEIDFLQEVHKENMSAIGGKAKSDSFFEFYKYFVEGKDFNIWVAYDNDKPVAAMLLFYYRNTVEYYTPVIREEYRDKQPLSLLIFDAMVDASTKGFEIWNWGGTWATQGGVYTFKKRWGTEDKNYSYFIQLNNEAVYSYSKEEILSSYPDFYLIPFNLLTGAQ